MLDRCAKCDRPLAFSRYAICMVCTDVRLCLSCAQDHFCTNECPERGCRAGLCVKVVSDGVVAREFGVQR